MFNFSFRKERVVYRYGRRFSDLLSDFRRVPDWPPIDDPRLTVGHLAIRMALLYVCLEGYGKRCYVLAGSCGLRSSSWYGSDFNIPRLSDISRTLGANLTNLHL